MVEPPKVPKVYCPKEDEEVPIWYCLGSFMQQREPCPELIKATVKIAEDYAKVHCKAYTWRVRARRFWRALTKKEAVKCRDP